MLKGAVVYLILSPNMYLTECNKLEQTCLVSLGRKMGGGEEGWILLKSICTEESRREERKYIFHVPFLYQRYNLDLDSLKDRPVFEVNHP